MQIAHFDGIAHNVIAEIVGGAVADALFYAAAGKPDRKCLGMMVAADIFHFLAAAVFLHGCAAESPPQTISVSSSSPRS